jgi:hypothetical protein
MTDTERIELGSLFGDEAATAELFNLENDLGDKLESPTDELAIRGVKLG